MDYEKSKNIHQISLGESNIRQVAISPDGHIIAYTLDVSKFMSVPLKEHLLGI